MNKKKSSTAKKAPEFETVAEFEALTDAAKEEVYRSVDREIDPSEMRPLTADERKLFEKFRRQSRKGRPKIGKGAHVVGISLEGDLLKKAEAFAKQNHMKRSELVAASLSLVMDNPKLLKRAGAA